MTFGNVGRSRVFLFFGRRRLLSLVFFSVCTFSFEGVCNVVVVDVKSTAARGLHCIIGRVGWSGIFVDLSSLTRCISTPWAVCNWPRHLSPIVTTRRVLSSWGVLWSNVIAFTAARHNGVRNDSSLPSTRALLTFWVTTFFWHYWANWWPHCWNLNALLVLL